MFKNIFDSHTHSENSPDGRDTAAQLAKTAYTGNMTGLAITDHCDCDIMEFMRYRERIRLSEQDTLLAKEAYDGKLIVTFGIELAEVFFDRESAEEILGARRYDFVLGSMHRILGYKAFFEFDYAKMTAGDIDIMLRQYFQEQVRFAQWGKFDALAHIAVPLRYMKAYSHIDIDLCLYKDEIDALLRLLVEKGIALELNMAGLRTAFGKPMPTPDILRRYRDMGGELVTIGSDAHTAGFVGSGVREGMELLREAGFRHYCFFRDRKPVMLKIE